MWRPREALDDASQRRRGPVVVVVDLLFLEGRRELPMATGQVIGLAEHLRIALTNFFHQLPETVAASIRHSTVASIIVDTASRRCRLFSSAVSLDLFSGSLIIRY